MGAPLRPQILAPSGRRGWNQRPQSAPNLVSQKKAAPTRLAVAITNAKPCSAEPASTNTGLRSTLGSGCRLEQRYSDAEQREQDKPDIDGNRWVEGDTKAEGAQIGVAVISDPEQGPP
jgi:hypothetical protein